MNKLLCLLLAITLINATSVHAMHSDSTNETSLSFTNAADFFSHYFSTTNFEHFDLILKNQDYITALQNSCNSITLDQWGKFLHDACQYSHLCAIKVVLAIVEVNDIPKLCTTKNLDGHTVLHTATKKCDGRKIVELILNKLTATHIKELFSITNRHNTTPLHIAAQWGRTKIVKLAFAKLPAKQAKELCFMKNDDGNTPLHIAAQFNNKEIVESILNKLNAEQAKKLCFMTNKWGHTPRYLAVGNGVALLEKAMQ